MAEATGVGFAREACAALVRLAPAIPVNGLSPAAPWSSRRSRRPAPPVLARTWQRNRRGRGSGGCAAVPASQLLRDDDDRFPQPRGSPVRAGGGARRGRSRIGRALRRSYAGFRGTGLWPRFSCWAPPVSARRKPLAPSLKRSSTVSQLYCASTCPNTASPTRWRGSSVRSRLRRPRNGGQLTESIRRRPASVVLLDEIEKAHREVLLVLLQVSRRRTPHRRSWRTVDFSASAIVMTSNLAVSATGRSRSARGLNHPGPGTLTPAPELWNRIDEVLCYARWPKPSWARSLRASRSNPAADCTPNAEFLCNRRQRGGPGSSV